MIVFRADGNPVIGLGHIMRCLSIAEAIKKRGGECAFITADSACKDIIIAAGFQLGSLDTDYRKMDGEIQILRKWLRSYHAKRLIVDSYYVTREYFEEISNDIPVVYLDDLMRAAYPVSALINYNLFADNDKYFKLYQASKVTCPLLYTGTKYVPLRSEFQGHPQREPHKNVDNVLVLTGGADSEHVALTYLNYLARHPSSFHYHFVIGSMNNDYEELNILAAGMENVILHRNVKRVYKLMSSCDVAITASGSTLYELSASCVPMISYVVADNQIDNAEAVEGAGASLYVGDVRGNDCFPDKLERSLRQLALDGQMRSRLTRNAYAMVDGNGADRLADILMKENEIAL